MTDLKIVTYTHSSCRDLWPMYFGQLAELLPELSGLVLSDAASEDYPGHIFKVYDDSAPYWTQWVMGLKECASEYFLYMQEDFLLYDRPDTEALYGYVSFLKEHQEISFVRLIANDLMEWTPIVEDLYHISPGTQYSFCMQPTIWRREDFLRLYTEARVRDYVERPQYVEASKRLNQRGAFVYRGESKRGSAHFNSSVFPYVATGLLRRKWNTMEYPEELKVLTSKYGIDMAVRGAFNPAEALEW